MTDEIDRSPSFFLMTAIILGAIVVLILFSWTSTVGTAVQEYYKLKDAPCESVIIIDTFTDIRGGYTTYYIVDDNNKQYSMYFPSDSLRLYEWNSIVKGQFHDIKRYNTRADFCTEEL